MCCFPALWRVRLPEIALLKEHQAIHNGPFLAMPIRLNEQRHYKGIPSERILFATASLVQKYRAKKLAFSFRLTFVVRTWIGQFRSSAGRRSF